MSYYHRRRCCRSCCRSSASGGGSPFRINGNLLILLLFLFLGRNQTGAVNRNTNIIRLNDDDFVYDGEFDD